MEYTIYSHLIAFDDDGDEIVVNMDEAYQKLYESVVLNQHYPIFHKHMSILNVSPIHIGLNVYTEFSMNEYMFESLINDSESYGLDMQISNAYLVKAYKDKMEIIKSKKFNL